MTPEQDKWPWVRDERFKQDKNLPLYIQLQNEIKALIDNRYWKAGEQIPTEADISKCLGMSVNTVKRGLYSLVLEGYLCRRQGFGTFVASMVDRPGSQHPFIKMVDGNGQLIGRIAATLLARGLEPAGPDIAAALNIRQNENIYHLRRLRAWQGEPVAAIDEWIVPSLFPDFLSVPAEDFDTFPLFFLIEKHYGFSWRNSVELLSVRPPTPQAAKDLKVQPGEPLLFSEVTFKTHDDTVIALRHSFIRTDTFRFYNSKTTD